MLNSKQIGNITEMESMLAFLKLGYNVLTPYGDCERYDFVADVNGNFYKIQCKTSHAFGENEGIEFSCRSSHRAEGKCINERYTANDVDFFATTFNGKCYLVPFNECGGSKKLRFVNPKNGQIQRVSFAENYELEKVLMTL